MEPEESCCSSDEDGRSLSVTIPITVIPILSPSITLYLELSSAITCNNARDHVLECAEEVLGAGRRWSSMKERWKKCERPLNLQENMTQCWLSWGGRHEEVDYVIREILQRQRSVENKKHVLKPNKKRSLKHTTVQVNALKEELRTLRLQRAEHSLSLSHDPKKIAIQQLEKMKLYQKKNQQLAGEVSWLNHQITILTDQLLSLRQGTHALSEGLARIKSGVISKQQQLEEELKQKEVSMREEISKTRRSLERQNKINELQEQKIDLAKNELLILKVTLEEKARALQNKDPLTADQGITTQSPHSSIQEDREKQGHKQNYTVATKHSAIFNERQRRLSAEEAKVFREADKSIKGETKETVELNSSLIVLASNDPRQKQNGILAECKKSETTTQVKAEKSVRFSAEALILNAALEGDLELLKRSFKKVRAFNMMTSISGTTCLHNAVQSGNIEVVEYLINQDFDINAQDCSGWTPLHYAVMHCSPSLLDLLITNGGSLFLRNGEDQSALDIAREEVKTKEGIVHQNAVICVKNIIKALSKLGRANRCVVYALFAYIASNREELSFLEGEQLVVITRAEDYEDWWFAENGRKMCGYIPSSYLGSHPRHQVIL